MRYKIGDRNSRQLFPLSIEEFVGENDPVRVYDAFVDNLDLESEGIVVEEDRVGRPAYDPYAMVKLLIYGVSYGIRSSRKLERACHHNVSFQYIMSGLKPSFKTIALFRSNNKKALKKILKKCVRLCMEVKLIDGNHLFIDGSKFRANASLNEIWTEDRCKKYLEKLDERIEDLLNSFEELDKQESDSDSLVEVKKNLQGLENRKEKIKAVLEQIKEEDLKSLNSTDKDCVRIKGRQGSHAGYNAQIVTDGKEGLIVSSNVVSSSSDYSEFSRQLENAEKILGKKAEVACADSGYHQVDDLEKISSREGDTKVIVPSREQVRNKKPKAFDKADFKYNSKTDELICPEGKVLRFSKLKNDGKSREYQMENYRDCLGCKHYNVCTKAKRGRTIHRLTKEVFKEKLEEVFSSEEGQKIYKLRQQKVELPFGHFKRNLGAGYFLLRGQDGVNAEMAILSTSFNISRMITKFGVPALVSMLKNGCI